IRRKLVTGVQTCALPISAAAEIRPFLQAFTLGRRLPRYSPSQIRDQIRAAEDLGITSWVLWNPRSVYQRGSLRPKQSGTRSPGQIGRASCRERGAEPEAS